MTRLRIASLFVAVVAGDYAALMLINGQLMDFGVAAAICAGSSVAAGLIGLRRQPTPQGGGARTSGRLGASRPAGDRRRPTVPVMRGRAPKIK